MKNTKKTVVAALFAAITCIATLISIPLPIGYANLGDAVVLLGAFLLGPLYGAISAGVGAALADTILGYAQYIPGTFVIKALCALAAVCISNFVSTRSRKHIIAYSVGAVVGECVMVFGYFVYEAVVLAYGTGAVVSIFGNMFQGLVGAASAILLVMPLKKLFDRSK